MAPEIQHGDYVIFDCDATPEVNDIVVAAVGGELFVKRLVEEGGERVLRGDADGSIVRLDEEAQIVGRVLFITRPK